MQVDNMELKITLQNFLKAFLDEYNFQLSNNKKLFLDQYNHTDFMLRKDGFLENVMSRLQSKEQMLEYRRENYSIDAVFIGGIDLFKSDYGYPSELHVLIEHEKRENIEEEMWKLIHWRAPLKVIIFYDWDEDEKSTNSRTNWVDTKIIKLLEMLDTVNAFFPENVDTEYLFLIGNRMDVNSIPTWRWTSNKSFKTEGILRCL
jgi:hypothetical protein